MLATPRFIALAGFGAVVFLLGAWQPLLLAVGAACNLALISALAADYLLSRRRPAELVAVRREVTDSLSLGAPNVVSLHLHNLSRAPVRLVAKDQPPPGLDHDGRPFRMLLQPGEAAVARYHITPRTKGDCEFGDIGLRLFSPLGLFLRQVMMPAARRLRVYPDLAAVTRYDLLARRGRLLEAGIRASRYRGRGTEFESLRLYLPDDDSRHINWKATARRHQLITSQFQSERSQNVILVLDAGRMMAGRVGGLAAKEAPQEAAAERQMTKLDHAINAALMSAYVASAMGDRVGLLAFAQEVHAYVPPRPGRRQVFRILEQLYRLEPQLVEPDYDDAFRYLALRQRRRSLVIVFTDLVDPDSSEDLLRHVGALHPHHLVLCCTLADPDLLAAAHAVPSASDQVYQKAVALNLVGDRRAALAYLRHRGVHLVDAPADELTTQTINRYLELKSRSLV